LQSALTKVQANFPGVSVKAIATGWQVQIPEKYHNGHEAHFGQVMEKYLEYVAQGALPAWEVPNMLAKYYTTTQARELAMQTK